MKKIIIFIVLIIPIFFSSCNKVIISNSELEQIKTDYKQLESVNNDILTENQTLDEEIDSLNKKIKKLEEEKLETMKEQQNQKSITTEVINNKNEDIVKEYNPFFVSSYGWDLKGDFTYLQEGNVLGGSVNGEWVSVKDFEIHNDSMHGGYVIDLMKGYSTYKICSLTKSLGSQTPNNHPVYSTPYSAGVPVNTVNISFNTAYEDDFIVGISCDWDPQPRFPIVENDGNRFVIDLDGDGSNEIIEKKVREGEHEAIEWCLTLEGQINSGYSYEYNDKYWWNSIMFVDLNGDNVLEIVQSSANHWIGIRVFEFTGSSLQSIFDYYIGD